MNLDHRRIDRNFALVAATIFNAHRSKKDKVAKPEDYLPTYRNIKHKLGRTMSADEIKNIIDERMKRNKTDTKGRQ